MPYSELIEVMNDYRAGQVERNEMEAAIALWQLKKNGGIADV